MEENLKQRKSNILRITTYGPESTGKTTLARDLARYFNTTWIVEYARDFLLEILGKEGRTCEEKDLLPIAIGQIAIENEALKKAHRFLFCDTNALVTKVYSDIYYNQCSPELEEAANLHHYDLYFLTDKDIPWEPDDLRDSAEYRDSSFEIFKKNLIQYNKPFVLISGNKEERLKKATQIVTDLEKALNAGLTNHEFVELYNQNKNIDLIIKQIHSLKKGIVKTTLEAPATIGNGIIKLDTQELNYYINYFDVNKTDKTLEKFIPASGAATRMFKFLNDFILDFNPEEETINGYINRTNNTALETFIAGIEKFPFYHQVVSKLVLQNNQYKKLSPSKKKYLFIKTILEDPDFNFLNKPKAVLPFHKYEEKIITPIEEHFKESNQYASCSNGNIHFTISIEHETLFSELIKQLPNELKENLRISFSYQDPSTDSIALTKNNKILKNAKGNFIFRPGGHGALLYNLNQREADILFIKNIDNVSRNHSEIITKYKKALAGILLEIRSESHNYLKELNKNKYNNILIQEIKNFIQEKLSIIINPDFDEYKEESQIKILKHFLNRPIRVCGMVKNENEPGGGPFWIKDKKGNSTLQIVESAQIDLENDEQKSIFKSATHFNPVDIVCSIKDYQGNKFNLLDFTDPNTGFVVKKNKDGIQYKSYELPGLWNGSMANWITLFVEVPLDTFTPVKTINDLLKPAHQPENL
ncbi:DUF4301 domain-containing protein [Flavobacterium columnare]|uniref:DUF4301 family protein n=1 Tax=Flavobacterium columnare TaxID=996 RepID=UPI000D1BDCED|nr:DUF4301 family protein [Flavobacterium columnare]MBF6651919.1 DUF4301 domain-containing protein [Flavobacterium columnare]MBF6655424.1 DUF4301 domain-containing protein [Flavobacterium columnare]MBF6658277.1 DUF4301 domain-containing protein [Flavobacterium columnare]PTD13762.1 DUF4301 domain-containing protein [Flavobacterium columnare]